MSASSHGAAALALAAGLAFTLVAPAAGQDAPADTLTLAGALRTALGHDPDLRVARADVSAARAGRWADWGAFLPTATGFASFDRTDFTQFTFVGEEGRSEELPEPIQDTRKGVNQSLSLDWTLLEGGQRIATWLEGDDARRAAAHRLSVEERRTVAEVRIAYYEARKQQRLVALSREELEARRRDLEMTRARYRIAAAERSDLLGARLELRQAELALLDARDARKATVRELRVAMGAEEAAVTEDVSLAEVETLPSAEALEASRLVERTLSGHPELAALEADAEAGRARLWSSRAAYLPDVSIGMNWGRSESLGPEGDLFVFDPRNRARGFRLSVSWNIFSGFQRHELAGQASAAITRARARRSKRELELEREVRDLVSEIRRRAERLEILRRNAELARQRLELVREQYRLGTTDYVDLQQAIRQVTGAERDFVRERYDYLISWAGLEQRVGKVEAPSRRP